MPKMGLPVERAEEGIQSKAEKREDTAFLNLKPQEDLSLCVLVVRSEDLPPWNSKFFVV